MRTPLRLASAGLVVAASLAYASRIETDNRIESWIDPSPEAQRHYEDLKQSFLDVPGFRKSFNSLTCNLCAFKVENFQVF